MAANLIRALEAFRGVVGAENVFGDEAFLASVATATFATTQTVVAVVRPASRAEIAECVLVARAERVPLYPVSRGRNIGYGSSVPASENCVVLDLRRMNRVIEVDEELAYAVVEPGVTFAQLHQHLRDAGSRLFVSVGGTVPDASVIGNSLERGIARGPNGDRLTSTCNFEVVLGTGETVETGFDRFPNAKAGNVTRSTLGPLVDGLFTQSNLGIVTRMTIWLSPLPEHLQTFFFRLEKEENMSRVIAAVRELRMRGVLRAPLLLANDYRYLSFTTQYPWEETMGATPLAGGVLDLLKQRHGLSTWAGDAALYAYTASQAESERAQVESLLGPCVDHLDFMTEDQARDDSRRGWRNMHVGIPNERTLESTYWRKRARPPADPDVHRDRVGVLWYAPAVPARGRDFQQVMNIIHDICLPSGFEPSVGIQFFSDRCMVLTGALLYDRDVEGEDARALACYHQLRAACDAAGYYPYRATIASMAGLPRSAGYDQLQDGLKAVCDPDGILAPGRYMPR